MATLVAMVNYPSMHTHHMGWCLSADTSNTPYFLAVTATVYLDIVLLAFECRKNVARRSGEAQKRPPSPCNWPSARPTTFIIPATCFFNKILRMSNSRGCATLQNCPFQWDRGITSSHLLAQTMSQKNAYTHSNLHCWLGRHRSAYFMLKSDIMEVLMCCGKLGLIHINTIFSIIKSGHISPTLQK